MIIRHLQSVKQYSFEYFYIFFLNFKNNCMKNNIILCELNGKMAYKKGINGYCYTFNKNEKSRRNAFNLALKSKIK